MPKVTGPLFSVEADGSLADAITYQRRPSGYAVYGYKKPKVPLTNAQLFQRELIRGAVKWWQGLSDSEKNIWEEKAKGQWQSGYSYFLKQNSDWAMYSDLALYLPLYDRGLRGDSFKSRDQYGHLCTNNGTVWGSQGRTGDGNDRISLGTPSAITGLSQGTIAIWVKVTTLEDGRALICYGGAKPTGNSGFFHMRVIQSTNYYFGFGQASDEWVAATTQIYRGGTQISAGTWYLVVLTSNGSTWKLYLGTVSAPPVEEALTSYYGTRGNDGNWFADTTLTAPKNIDLFAQLYNGAYVNYLIGTEGEVFIYVSARSLSELAKLHGATKWRYS